MPEPMPESTPVPTPEGNSPPDPNQYRVANQLAAKRAAAPPIKTPNLVVLNDPVAIGKVRRAHLKAKLDVSPEDQKVFLTRLLALGVPVAHIGSKRIAKVLTGELKMEDLLKRGGGKRPS